MVKNPPASAGDIRDMGSIPGSGRSPGGGHGNPLQYSCLENSMDRGSLAGYSPWGFKELDVTEVTEHNTAQDLDQTFTLFCWGLLGSVWSAEVVFRGRQILAHPLTEDILFLNVCRNYCWDPEPLLGSEFNVSEFVACRNWR